MATRSRIAIENQDGTVTSIYCHWDGGIGTNGERLSQNYATTELVSGLIELGNISSLGESTEDTVAFARDRGEDFKQTTYENVPTLFEDGFENGVEFVYCFIKDQFWLVSDGGPVFDLEEAIEEGYF
jgi:hypothetical protein